MSVFETAVQLVDDVYVYFFPPPPPPPPPLIDATTIGVALACLAAAMAAVGINLQRLGRRSGRPAVSLLGVVLATTCGVADMASFQFAPASLLAPFASFGLLVNLFLAPIHGEKIALFDIVCTVLVVSGVAVCLSSAATAVPSRTLDEIRALAVRPAFLCWVAVEATVLAAAMLRAMLGAVHSLLTAVAMAVAAGVCGGCTMLSAKILTECVAAGAPLIALALIGGLLGTVALTQVVTTNAAVGRYTPLLIVPLLTASSLTTNASGGGIFFEEFALLSDEQRSGYLTGVVLLLSGVLLIASKAGGDIAQPKSKAA